MNPLTGEKAPSTEAKESVLKSFVAKLRKRHILETFAGFIAGGWLFLEFVDRILVAHYHINEKWLDVAFFTLLGAFLCVILWRWFSGTEKRPGNVKLEVLIVPLIILITLAIDLNLILQVARVPGKKLLIGIVAFLLGITWAIFKLSQWAAITPESAKKKIEVSTPVTVRPEKSIVVLPFKNISPEEGQDYFSDGMTEELITKLSKVLSLRVISRTSAFMFKDTPKSVRNIAQELNVGYILEGSVRRAGNKLRIVAQCIDAATDAHIWADTYDGVLEDVFDIQEKVSAAIVDALRLKLSPDEQRKIAERPIDNITAYDWYVRAIGTRSIYTEEAFQEAIRYLEYAISIIGDNALIYSGMAYMYFLLMNINVKMELNRENAEKFVRKALALDQGMPKARALLGYLSIWYRGKEANQKEAVRQCKMALVADPSEPMALLGLCFVYLWTGRISAAMPLMERYRKVEPLDVWALWMPGAFHYYDGQYELALRDWHRLYEMNPYPGAYTSYAWALAYNKHINEALAVIEEGVTKAPSHVHTKMSLMLKHALRGDKQGALKELTPEFYDWCRREGLWSYSIATYFALLNANEEALDWLENAVDLGHINYPLFAEKDPWLASIRGEERFKKLMERVKYEWEHFEV